ncbi:MAG TPA: flippase [Acidimicrobiales bacterium]|nr:flippase [Acidimicrobiales bacterium]
MSAPAAASRRGDNRELVALARGGGLNFIGAAVTQVAAMVVLLLLTRNLPKTDVGLFRQSFALFSLLQIVALLGLGQALTRFVAVFRADKDRAAVLGTVRWGMAVASGAAIAAGVGLYALSGWIANTIYNNPSLQNPLEYVAVAIPPAAITMAALAACSGFRTMRPNALIGLMLDPLLRVVLTAAAISSGSGLEGVLRAFVVVPYITALLALIWLAVLMRGPRIAARIESGEIMRFASVAWLATFTTQALLWVDQLILPLYVSSAELAIYSVATSVVVLATFAMSPISQSLAPRVADLTRRRELRRLGIAYKAAASWMLRFALPFFAIIFIFPRPLLGVFGTGYGLGATVTVILAFGKLTDVATGPCGTMLNQAGLNKLSLLDNIVALAINLGLNFLLIPEYGIRGAAVAWTISLVLVNAARALQVRRYIVPVWPFSDGTPKALAAFAWSVLAALVVRELVDGSPRKELYIATPVVFGLYITLVVALGLTAEDRLVLGDLTSILRRRRRAPRPSAPGDTVRVPAPAPVAVTEDVTVAEPSVEVEGTPARLARRFRRRRHLDQRPGTVEVVLDELVSPLRYDVIVRQEFFAFLDTNAELLEEFGDLVLEAKSTPYYLWYRDIVIGDRVKLLKGRSLDGAFADQIERVLAVRARFNPADESWGDILLRRLPAGSRTATGKIVGPRFVPVDGCHRIALLRHHGRKLLPAESYRLVGDKQSARDNTAVLIPKLHLTEAQYLDYLAMGFGVDSPSSFAELVAAVAARQPARSAELESVISIDLPLLLRSFGPGPGER